MVKDKQLNAELLDFSGDWLRVGLAWLEKILLKALGERVEMLGILPTAFSEVRKVVYFNLSKSKPIKPIN